MEITPPITVSLANLDAEQCSAIVPHVSGVYAFLTGNQIVHVGWASNLANRLGRILSKTSVQAVTLGSRMRAAGFVLQCWPTFSKLESALVMYHVVKANSPRNYRARLRLRLPWFLTFTPRDPFPRLTLANRFPNGGELVVGPFPSRDAAQRYADEVGGLFSIRKCVDPLTPSPDHPGCLYGEMNQCLRPCQVKVSETEYQTEVQLVSRFLLTNGKTVLGPAVRARDEAASAMDFERAAQIHRQINKIKDAEKARDELVCEARALGGVALTKGASGDELQLWPMVNGLWQEARTLKVSGENSVDDLETSCRDALESVMANPGNASGDSPEHLAILLRWYHSSWRDGDWFPLTAKGTISYRRMARSIVRRVAPVSPAAQS